jgi:hypothetical protein
MSKPGGDPSSGMLGRTLKPAVLKGGGRGPTKIAVVLLSDGAGEVATIGEGVTRVAVQTMRDVPYDRKMSTA